VTFSAEAFEDRLDLDIELLQSVSLTSNPPSEQLSAYPFPFLVGSGKSQSITLRTVILENDFLRVTILPDLGGRISSLFDKRTQLELLSQEFRFEEGGPRGMELRQGIEFDLRPDSRRNRLGPVDFVFGQEEDVAQVTIWELAGPLSWHFVFSLQR